mmetsp:Transcript_6734/g.11869  ORF Transcript_6734/g.11869 Transcript_6734/m.11869 type:complete len:214 (-) Transcript_6734:253-894(-)
MTFSVGWWKEVNNALVRLSYRSVDTVNDASHNLFTVFVADRELFSEVHKNVPKEAMNASQEETYVVISAKLVPFYSLCARYSTHHHSCMRLYQVFCKLSFMCFHVHKPVQLSQLRNACFSASGVSHVIFPEKKVRSQVLNSHRCFISQGYRAWPGQHKVLGDLNTHAPNPNNKHPHFDKLCHCFYAISPDLPAVPVHCVGISLECFRVFRHGA